MNKARRNDFSNRISCPRSVCLSRAVPPSIRPLKSRNKKVYSFPRPPSLSLRAQYRQIEVARKLPTESIKEQKERVEGEERIQLVVKKTTCILGERYRLSENCHYPPFCFHFPSQIGPLSVIILLRNSNATE